jgi:hypothetical protein
VIVILQLLNFHLLFPCLLTFLLLYHVLMLILLQSVLHPDILIFFIPFSKLILAISSFEASFVLGIMRYKLFSWFIINPKDSKIILFYLLSMIFTSFSLGLNGIVVFNGLIFNNSLLIQPNQSVIFPIITFESYGILFTLFAITLISYISAYLSIWTGTVSLFYTYLQTNKLHKKKIWLFTFASLLFLPNCYYSYSVFHSF